MKQKLLILIFLLAIAFIIILSIIFIQNSSKRTIKNDEKNVNDCLGCEFCHETGKGQCSQKDDMYEIYKSMKESEMLVLASPIYYKGVSGKLKCVIDRFYAVLYPSNQTNIKKIAMFLASGSSHQYEGAIFSYEGDFIDYLGLEGMGVYTSYDDNIDEKLKELGKSL